MKNPCLPRCVHAIARAAVVCLLAATTTAPAAENAGAIAGRVYNPGTREYVRNAEVRLQEEIDQSKYAFGQLDMPAAEFAAVHRGLFDQF